MLGIPRENRPDAGLDLQGGFELSSLTAVEGAWGYIGF